MVSRNRSAWMIMLCCAAGACRTGHGNHATVRVLPAIVVVPGEVAVAAPKRVTDMALAADGAWRVALATPGDAAGGIAVWDLRHPAASVAQLPGAASAVFDRASDGLFTASPDMSADAAVLPVIALALVDAAGATRCRVLVEGTGQLQTSAMATAARGLAWVGQFSGAITVGQRHLVAADDSDGVAIFLTRACEVTGAIRLAGPRTEGMATVTAWPAADAAAPPDWIVVGRFAERALLGGTPLAAELTGGGIVHSLVVARVGSTGEVRWASTMSSGAPLFATAAAPSDGEGAAPSVAVVGAMRGPATVVDATSSRSSMPAGAGGDPKRNPINASDGFVWQIGRDGAVQAFSRAPYQGQSDVTSVVRGAGRWLIAGQLRGQAPGQPAQRFGLFVATVRDEAWTTTQLLPAPGPVVGWLAAIAQARTALLVSYDGTTLHWQAATTP